jgi:hypothetical protein
MTVWAALALLASAAAPVACPHAGNSVVVDAATRVLVLCEAGSPTRTFGLSDRGAAEGGIHGRRRRRARPAPLPALARPLNNVFASTAGCVGVASDDEIDAIATWVTANHVGRIEIR